MPKKLKAKAKGSTGVKAANKGTGYEYLHNKGYVDTTNVSNKPAKGYGYIDVGIGEYMNFGEDKRPYYGKIGGSARIWDAGAGKGKEVKASLKKKSKPVSAKKRKG